MPANVCMRAFPSSLLTAPFACVPSPGFTHIPGLRHRLTSYECVHARAHTHAHTHTHVLALFLQVCEGEVPEIRSGQGPGTSCHRFREVVRSLVCMYECACLPACLPACVRACLRACVRACACVRVFVRARCVRPLERARKSVRLLSPVPLDSSPASTSNPRPRSPLLPSRRAHPTPRTRKAQIDQGLQGHQARLNRAAAPRAPPVHSSGLYRQVPFIICPPAPALHSAPPHTHTTCPPRHSSYAMHLCLHVKSTACIY